MIEASKHLETTLWLGGYTHLLYTGYGKYNQSPGNKMSLQINESISDYVVAVWFQAGT